VLYQKGKVADRFVWSGTLIFTQSIVHAAVKRQVSGKRQSHQKFYLAAPRADYAELSSVNDGAPGPQSALPLIAPPGEIRALSHAPRMNFQAVKSSWTAASHFIQSMLPRYTGPRRRATTPFNRSFQNAAFNQLNGVKLHRM
jgi:hypothetical protein